MMPPVDELEFDDTQFKRPHEGSYNMQRAGTEAVRLYGLLDAQLPQLNLQQRVCQRCYF